MFKLLQQQMNSLRDDLERVLYNLENPEDEKAMQSITKLSQLHKSVKDLNESKTGNEDVDFIMKRITEIYGG